MTMSKRRDAVAGIFARQAGDAEASIVASTPLLPAALGAMRSSLLELSNEAERARLLESQIEAGDRVIEIDPAHVESSFVQDRMALADDPGFESFVSSMEGGQKVPILVRPHPGRDGYFQAAYGHRRLRAAQRLGRKVKAIVQHLTDAELVVAQGKENSERRDLSFIERAMFAASLEDRGFGRPIIMEALTVDKGDLSRLLSIARGIPSEIILAIGPAPKVGRARWLQLVDVMSRKEGTTIVGRTIDSRDFKSADTSDRVTLLIKALSEVSRRIETEAVVVNDKPIARIERRGRRFRLTVENASFGRFLAASLPRLHSEFLSELERRSDEPQPAKIETQRP
jgi:ParB family chromosome partitioning protein